jgi:hypothetical protein
MKNNVTRRFMRKMKRFTRRAATPFRTKSFGKLMRKLKQKQHGGASQLGLIKVPAAAINFNFAKAVSTLPATFGTLATSPATTSPATTISSSTSTKLATTGSSSTSTKDPQLDSSTFTINLAPTYTPANLPHFIVTGYIYSRTAGYIQVQRQFGVQTGTAAAQITIDSAVKKIIFTNITKQQNFPYTQNDTQGYALYLAFEILN